MHNDMSLPIALFVFIASIFFLVKSADYFTTYSEKVGRLMHMPAFACIAGAERLEPSRGPKLNTGLLSPHCTATNASASRRPRS